MSSKTIRNAIIELSSLFRWKEKHRLASPLASKDVIECNLVNHFFPQSGFPLSLTSPLDRGFSGQIWYIILMILINWQLHFCGGVQLIEINKSHCNTRDKVLRWTDKPNEENNNYITLIIILAIGLIHCWVTVLNLLFSQLRICTTGSDHSCIL